MPLVMLMKTSFKPRPAQSPLPGPSRPRAPGSPKWLPLDLQPALHPIPAHLRPPRSPLSHRDPDPSEHPSRSPEPTSGPRKIQVLSFSMGRPLLPQVGAQTALLLLFRMVLRQGMSLSLSLSVVRSATVSLFL